MARQFWSRQICISLVSIKRMTGKFELDKYKALREFIDAKLKHVALPPAEKRGNPANVIDLMDSLSKSVQSGPAKKPVRRTGGKEAAANHRLEVVGLSAKTSPKNRKSA